MFPILVYSQTGEAKNVYLKDGKMIKGTILELIPGQTVKIQTADSSLFVFPLSDIEKIVQDTVTVGKQNIVRDTLTVREQNIVRDSLEAPLPSAVSLIGGVAIPAGDFADKAKGAAATGFTIGVQYVSKGKLGFIFSGDYSSNKLDLSAASAQGGFTIDTKSWESFCFLAGLKIGFPTESHTQLFLAPLVGVLCGTIPEIRMRFTSGFLTISDFNLAIYPTDITVSQTSASKTAFAYGLALEYTLGRHIALGARYITSKPEFGVQDKVEGSGQNTSGQYVYVVGAKSGTVAQTVSLVKFYIGVIL